MFRHVTDSTCYFTTVGNKTIGFQEGINSHYCLPWYDAMYRGTKHKIFGRTCWEVLQWYNTTLRNIDGYLPNYKAYYKASHLMWNCICHNKGRKTPRAYCTYTENVTDRQQRENSRVECNRSMKNTMTKQYIYFPPEEVNNNSDKKIILDTQYRPSLKDYVSFIRIHRRSLEWLNQRKYDERNIQNIWVKVKMHVKL